MADLLLHTDDDFTAVLDFIDNFECDLELDMPPTPSTQPSSPSSRSSSPTPTSPTSSPPSSPTPSVAAKRPRMHSGQRVRAEIQRLRASVVELEACVQQLKQRRPGDATAVKTEPHTRSGALVARSWEDIAQRQKAQCQHVQHENARLRAMLLYQARVARKLETVVARARRVEQTKRARRELIAERASEPWSVGCERLEVRTAS